MHIRTLVKGVLTCLLLLSFVSVLNAADDTGFTNLSRETIKQSPEYTEESLLTRDYGPECMNFTSARILGQ